MLSWQLLSYDDGNVHLTNTSIPKITCPLQVLVKIKASSVNTLDVYMMEGYGHVALNYVKKFIYFISNMSYCEFPITCGRDFVGEVIDVGEKVNCEFKKGTIVMGVTLPSRDGSHAEYVVVNQYFITKKPEHMKIEDAVSFLYTGITAWSALNFAGDLIFRQRNDKTVLVLGASGGVGTVAVQLLKSWGSKVVATCSSDGISVVEKLNPDIIVDYTISSFFDNIKQYGPYDIILDAAGIDESQIGNYIPVLKSFSFSKFISLKPSILPNIDKYGMFIGTVKSVYDVIQINILRAQFYKTNTIRYGLFLPLRNAIEELGSMMESNKLRPVIDSVFSFSEIPEAYKRVQQGHLRGLNPQIILRKSQRKRMTGDH